MLGYQECFDIIAEKLNRERVYRLGIKLKLPDNEVDDICNGNFSRYDKTYKILRLWRNKTGKQADINQVIASLRDMNENDIADIIEATLDSSK